MPNDKSLREHLISLLNDGSAHLTFDAAVKDMPANLRGTRPKGSAHSPWELLEHLRITQWDILEYCRNPQHVSPEFPAGYWPSTQAPSNEKAWDKSTEAFRTDLQAIIKIVEDKKTDLFAPLPHSNEGHTIFREVLLVADHSAYHLGQLVLLRRTLGAWQNAESKSA